MQSQNNLALRGSTDPVIGETTSSVSNVPILNIDVDNWLFSDFIENLTSGVVFTVNVDHLSKLQHDKAFYDCYRQADHVVCDSKVLMFLSKIVDPKRKIRAQIAGSDLFPAFCMRRHAEADQFGVFLLGGSPESVIEAQDKINQRSGGDIIIGGYSPPFGFEKNEKETDAIIAKVNASGASVLAVGVGAPKQEKWILANKHRMPAIRIFFAIGATIEFEAGALTRAPAWATNMGFEWLFRMFQEPKRLVKRYLIDDLPVLLLILKQRLGTYRNPWK